MENASGRIMTGIRAFSACLPLTSLLLSWPSTAFRLLVYQYYILYTIAIAIAFQVNTGVSYLLDYVEDIYDRWWSSLSRLTQTL